jgi:ketosteroid isomerase-like protein
MEDRIEAARQVIRDFDIGDEWDAVIEDGVPPELAALAREFVDGYRRADIEWLLEHTDPDAEISQIAELPDSKNYRGRDGFIEAMLDWPRQWEDFQIEPRSIFGVGDDQLVIVGIHRGRPQMIDIQVEAQIVFLQRWRDRRMTDWNMFLTVEEAVEAAQARVG